MHRVSLPRCLQPWRCELTRIGHQHGDCGYLINARDIPRTDMVLSFGIGDNWMFEQHWVELNDCPVLAYDMPTDRKFPGRDDFFQGPRQLINGEVGSSGSTLDDIWQPHWHDVFLKCDIEGSEYSLFDDIINRRHGFTGICMEVHDINVRDNLDRLCDFMTRLCMPLVHLHVNNWFYYLQGDQAIPDVFEMTFSSDPEVKLDRAMTLPHQLDRVNNPNNPEFSMTWNQGSVA